MLNYNPDKRPTAAEALQHPFFQCHIPIPQSVSLENLAKKFYNDSLKKDKDKEEEKFDEQSLEKFPQLIEEELQGERQVAPPSNNITRLHIKNSRYRPGVDSVAITLKGQKA